VRAEVLNGELVVPVAATERRGLGGDEDAAVVGQIDRLQDDIGIGCGPGVDRRLLLFTRPGQHEIEVGAGHEDLPVGGVVVLLAGRAVVRGDVLSLDEVERGRVELRVEVVVVDLQSLVGRAA